MVYVFIDWKIWRKVLPRVVVAGILLGKNRRTKRSLPFNGAHGKKHTHNATTTTFRGNGINTLTDNAHTHQPEKVTLKFSQSEAVQRQLANGKRQSNKVFLCGQMASSFIALLLRFLAQQRRPPQTRCECHFSETLLSLAHRIIFPAIIKILRLLVRSNHRFSGTSILHFHFDCEP